MRTESFYDVLPRETEFARMTEAAAFRPLPSDWLVGVADVIGSTGHVAAGRYKTVNMVGAAVISAVMNATGGRPFPFVFGGDGASLAVGPERADTTGAAMAAVTRWARDEFGMELRVALVPVSDLRAAGQDVQVARFRVSENADYAMFRGGGLSLAEDRLKAGDIALPEAPAGTVPDLSGLSCRWAHMRSRQGSILSLVASARSGADADAVAGVFRNVIAIAETLERGGHPAPATGMEARWPPEGASLEARARRRGGSLRVAWARALLEAFVARLLMSMGLSVGGFDARRYARVVAANADFRKLDDGLKMTLDCDAATRERIETVLTDAAKAGLIRFGIAAQEEAMMTCIVHSILTDDHLHFIDGAAGGYTSAATAMKAT